MVSPPERGEGTIRRKIAIDLRLPMTCPAEAVTFNLLEGEIFDGRGVTYIVPAVDSRRCSGDSSVVEVELPWERRADTDWTLVVVGFRDGDRLMRIPLATTPGAPLSPGRERRMPVTGVMLANAPRMRSLEVTRDGRMVVLDTTQEYGNPCLADQPWTVQPIAWPESDGAVVWAQPSPPPSMSPCAEIYSPAVRKITYRLALPGDLGLRVRVIVPDVPQTSGLPIWIAEALRQP
jgi:hypothetical protein